MSGRARHAIDAAAVIVLLCVSAAACAQDRTWSFRVDLDGSPIGHHVFTLREQQGGERELVSEARFSVKVLGIVAYRYAHDATEHWRGNCLERLAARTDDDGNRLDVTARIAGATMAVSSAHGQRELGGCVMSFASWNPAILSQHRLLNTQTGDYEAVSAQALGRESITVQSTQIEASHFRLTGPKHPIDLWYSAQNDWVALESSVDGGRRLRYTAINTRTHR